MQVDVGQQRGNDPALRGAGDAASDHPVLHHPGAQHGAQELEDVTVADALLDRLHQPVVRDRLEARGDIRLDHPPSTLVGLVDEHLQRVVSPALGTKPKRARQEVGFEDRLDRRFQRRLHDAVTDSGDRQRSLLTRAGLWYEHPTRRQRPPTAVLEVRGQLVEQPSNPVPLDVSDADLVDARSAAVAAHLLPRALQHVSAIDLVIERVEPSFGVGLGRPVQRPLQVLDLVVLGGTSHEGTHQPFPTPKRIDEAAALPSPAVVLSARLKQYYGRLRRPPGSQPTSRRKPVIGRGAPAATSQTTGPGRASPVPAVTI